jgi:response regulator RpfG family c-di-GMP phosphodiesterase
MSSQPKWQSIPAAESSKRLTILYIEENESLFRQVKGSLESAGYSVVGATNSWQAQALLLKTPIRLVVGGDLLCREEGRDLVARMKEIQPDIAVVVRSRFLPSSMKGVDLFISADEPWPNFLTFVKDSFNR